MKLRARALSVAVPLLIGASVVAVQSNGSAGAAPTVLTIAAPAKVGYSADTTSTATRLWSQCVVATNVARSEKGLVPLQLDIRVAMAAAGQSAYQAQAQRMSHTGTGGSNAGNRLDAAGYSWSTWGENVAAGQADCATVLTAWLGSPSHRANILNPAFRHIGIGMALGANGVPYWTMDLAAGG